MQKLFEIPIYALSRETLKKRVAKKIEPYQSDKYDQRTRQALINVAAGPASSWEYNHIVGYIQITYDMDQFTFYYELYMPSSLKQYRWDSSKKTLLINRRVNGQHFYIEKMMGNQQIAEKVRHNLLDMIHDFIPDKYYVDLTAFDSLNPYLDYRRIIEDGVK